MELRTLCRWVVVLLLSAAVHTVWAGSRGATIAGYLYGSDGITPQPGQQINLVQFVNKGWEIEMSHSSLVTDAKGHFFITIKETSPQAIDPLTVHVASINGLGLCNAETDVPNVSVGQSRYVKLIEGQIQFCD